MTQSLRAIYRNGAFIPQTAFELPEGTEVELLVQSPQDATPILPNANTLADSSQNEEHSPALVQDDLLTEKQTSQDQNGVSHSESSPNSLTFDADATPIWELAAQLSAQVPDEEWEKLPKDLSKRFDYYQQQRQQQGQD
jgi:type I restriction enzyme S subunit